MKIAHKILAIAWLILGSISGLFLQCMLDGKFKLNDTLYCAVPLILGSQLGIFVGVTKGMNPFWTAIYGFLLGAIVLIAFTAAMIWLLANFGV